MPYLHRAFPGFGSLSERHPPAPRRQDVGLADD